MIGVGWVALFATQQDWHRCWVAKSMQPNLHFKWFITLDSYNPLIT